MAVFKVYIGLYVPLRNSFNAFTWTNTFSFIGDTLNSPQDNLTSVGDTHDALTLVGATQILYVMKINQSNTFFITSIMMTV